MSPTPSPQSWLVASNPQPGRPNLRRRLDSELVTRGLLPSRAAAQDAIVRGLVVVDGVPTPKPATLVTPTQSLVLAGPARVWASRGGEKLDAAISAFQLDVADALALDVGASTGGFTDVLLHHGARRVVALDVGYGQLAWDLRQDPRVEVRERLNFRHVDPKDIGAPFDIIVVDVSFIGVTAIAAKLAACAKPGSAVVVLVKPQFELGRDRVGPGGIVVDPDGHRDAVVVVASALATVGLAPQAATPSPITGAAGNREFLLLAVAGADSVDIDAVATAVVA